MGLHLHPRLWHAVSQSVWRERLPLAVLSLSSHLQDRFAFVPSLAPSFSFSYVFDKQALIGKDTSLGLHGVPPRPLGTPVLTVRRSMGVVCSC